MWDVECAKRSVPTACAVGGHALRALPTLTLVTEPERQMNGRFGGGSDGVWHNPRHRFDRWRFGNLEVPAHHGQRLPERTDAEDVDATDEGGLLHLRFGHDDPGDPARGGSHHHRQDAGHAPDPAVEAQLPEQHRTVLCSNHNL